MSSKRDNKWASRTVGSGRSKADRVKSLDGYHTPRVAIEHLLRHVRLNRNIWEPANGFHRISRILEASGYRVATSDVHRWCRGTQVVKDFRLFTDRTKPFRRSGCDIVTNPPFVLAQDFVEHAMSLLRPGGRLCLLLRLQFLEGSKRYKMYHRYPPARVFVFSGRLPFMHAFNYKGKKSGKGMLAFAWFVWEKGFRGKTVIEWIDS